MTFLSPLPAIIAACVATPILLLYYFLKLRRRAVRVSSTLLWERAIKDLQVNTPFRWLRFSFLLLLQLLILAALLLAMARPALDDPLGATSRVILLVDRSASMDAHDGIDTTRASETATPRVSRLAQAKLEAGRVIDKLSGGGWFARLFGSPQPAAAVCVIEFAATARVRTPFTSDYASVREAIESIGQSDQPGNLAAALQLIAGLTSGSGDESETRDPPTVFVFSDGSFPHEPGELTAPRAFIRYMQIGPTPIERDKAGASPSPAGATASTSSTSPPTIVTDSIQPTENLGITAISARRDPESPSTVRVFVRVQSNAARTIRGVARLTLNGVESGMRPFTVEPATVQAPSSSPTSGANGAETKRENPRGESTTSPKERAASSDAWESPVTFEVESSEGGTIVVSLTSIDLLSCDDAAAVVLAPAAKPRILIVARDAKPDDLLMLALEGLGPAALSSLEPAYYEQFASGGRVIDAAGNEFTSRLSDWDLVIFDRYRPERMPAAPTPTISIGAGLPVAGLVLRGAANDAGVSRFSTWRRTHPVMRSVNLDGIIVSPAMTMQLPDSQAINATVLAWGDGGGAGVDGKGVTELSAAGGTAPLIALLEPVSAATNPANIADGNGVGGGKRLLLAFELAQTNWGIEFSFPVFIFNAVEYLSVASTGQVSRSYRTDEPITLSIPPNTLVSVPKEATVEGPLKLTVPVRGGEAIPNATPGGPTSAAAAEIPIGTLERAGVYRVRAGSGGNGTELPGVLGTLAANLVDPWESQACVATRLDVPESSGISGARTNVDSRREVWHWFVAAALALLLVEWFLFARGMRT